DLLRIHTGAIQRPAANKEELMAIYYCPRGCNVCDERAVQALGLECGACGSIMTTDQDAFEEARERQEILRTAEVTEDSNGFYISSEYPAGIRDRVSFEYWQTRNAAEQALRCGRWTERDFRSSAWAWGN